MVNSSFIYPFLQNPSSVAPGCCVGGEEHPDGDLRREGSDLYRTLPVGAPAAAMLAAASSMLRLGGGPLRID
jgi:hypothetical protein